MASQNPFPSRDAAQEILDASGVQSNRLKASAWDVYYKSQDEQSFKLSLDSLPLPKETKAALWDAKFGKPAPENQITQGINRALDVMNPMNAVRFANQALLPEAITKQFDPNADTPNTGIAEWVPGGVRMLTDEVGRVIGQLGAAAQSAASGDLGGAASHAMTAVPVAGPVSNQVATDFEQGNTGQAVGTMVGTAANMLGPDLLSRARVPVGPLTKNPNPLETAAVQYANQRGIPVDAATATGHRGVANVQKRVSESMGGASVARNFKAEQAKALSQEADTLAGRANQARTGQPGKPYDAVSAGEAVQGRLESRINAQARAADRSYDRLRALEEQRNQVAQQTGGVQAPPGAAMPFTKVPLAVDVRAAKASLAPLYQSLLRERDLGVPMQGGKGRTLVALDGLMKGPDTAPLSVVDSALGDLKAMSRTDDLPALRTPGQATAAQAVKALEAEVIAAAKRGGPDVMKALQTGRQATIGKYTTAKVRDTLSGEPATVYKQLTQGGDTGLNRLQALAKQTPREVPKIARAYLENAIELATREGGFGHADRLWSDWHKLGPETKQVLFPDKALRRDLDNFFMLAKKANENVNPSGTAGAVTAVNMWSAVPANVLGRMLYSRTGVQALTRGVTLQLSKGAARGARTLPAVDLAQIAREWTAQQPALAEDEQSPEPVRAKSVGPRSGQR